MIMFILELTYTAPLERVDAALAAHNEWLDGHYAVGVFLASGPKAPRDGGVIIASGEDRAKIEEIAKSDPFSLAGVAEYAITQFVATKTAPTLEPYRQDLPR